jgi:hypothetical protein
MDDRTEIGDTAIFKSVTEHGKTVTVTVYPIENEDNLWELSIEGKGNQFTTWTEWFTSVEDAMNAGLSAILKEGIDEFYSDPEFHHSP